MLIPTDIRRSIFEKLFQEGVLTAMNDIRPKTVNPLVGCKNLYVVNLMKSFTSKGYVRKQYAWRCYYWFLTDSGITYLREVLHLPDEIVPATYIKQTPDAKQHDLSIDPRGVSDRYAFRKGQVGGAPAGKTIPAEGELKFKGFGRGAR